MDRYKFLRKLDKLIDKHTVALTKTTEPDGTEIRSFDTRVVDTFKLAQEIADMVEVYYGFKDGGDE